MMVAALTSWMLAELEAAVRLAGPILLGKICHTNEEEIQIAHYETDACARARQMSRCRSATVDDRT